MGRLRFSLASLMVTVLVTGLVCSMLIYARRASLLQAERAKQDARLRALEKKLGVMFDQRERTLAQLIETELHHQHSQMQAELKFEVFRAKVTNLMVQTLNDKAPAVRQAAARILGEIGPEAQEAAVLLNRLLEDEDDGVRTVAAAALQKIQPDSSPAEGY